MSTAEQPVEADTEEPGEPGPMSERTAKAVLVAVALLATWGIVAALPETAYIVVGVLGCLAWQKGRTWLRDRRDVEGQQTENAPAPDVAEILRQLSHNGREGLLLTRLCAPLNVAKTRDVKQLLDDAGVPWRPGVRTPQGNGPGVHKTDIPPAPSPVGHTHDDGCCCRSGANANANNGQSGEPQEGFRVVPIGTEGRIVYDLRDPVRHHPVRDH